MKDSLFVKHVTLLTSGPRLKRWETLNEEFKTKPKQWGQPIVDANNGIKLLSFLAAHRGCQ